jgi:hypothetical protein
VNVMSEFYQHTVEIMQSKAARIAALGLSAFAIGVSHAPAAYAENCVTEQTSADTTTQTCYDDLGQVTSIETTTTNYDEPQGTEPTPEVQPVTPDSHTTKHPESPSKKKHTTSSSERQSRNQFVNYNQAAWERPGTACGPTSIGMVTATLKGNKHITPNTMTHQIPKKWYWPGSGTDPHAFFYIGNKYDIDVEHGDLNDARRVIEDGGLAIVHAKPGYFTANGHYMVLRAVKNGKFRIADPNGKGRHGDSESHLWGARELRAKGIDDVWTFENE